MGLPVSSARPTARVSSERPWGAVIFVTGLDTNIGPFTHKMRFVPALSPILGFGTNMRNARRIGTALTRIMGDSCVKCDSCQLYALFVTNVTNTIGHEELGQGLSRNIEFVPNTNIGDKAGTNRILRVNRVLFVTNGLCLSTEDD